MTLFPDQVDQAFLDKMGNYILRKTDAFMRTNLTEDQANEIKRKIEEYKNEKEEQEKIIDYMMQEEEQKKTKNGFGQKIQKIINKIKVSGE